MTEEEAKKAFQLEEQRYLHDLMEQNGSWLDGNDKDKGLTQWVFAEREKWKINKDGGIDDSNLGYVPPEYMEEFRKKYGFYTGGQTERTGWHWLDGQVGKPEEVLSAEDTKYWRQMIDMSPEFLKAMRSISVAKNGVSGSSSVEINVESMITIEGNVDKSILPDIKNAGNEIITSLKEAMTRKTGR